MKRFLLLLVTVCHSGFAAGPWDGIYQTGPKNFLSIHQKGTTLIVGGFHTFPPLGSLVDIGDGQRFFPPRADVWELLSGELSGSSATLTGEVAYGACLGNFTISFHTGGAFIARNSYSTTSAGREQGVNCAALFELQRSYGYGLDAVKVF